MKEKMRLRITRMIIPALALSLVSIGVALAAADALGVRQARDVLRKIAGANLGSDQVRIKNISSGVGSGGVIVVAQIETAFRMVQDGRDWKVADVRLGDRQWESFELIEEAVRREKERRTTAIMKKIEEAIDSYRRDRGVYMDADDIGELLDYISPAYLSAPARFDLWGEQFEFKASRDRYRLVSRGADRRKDTADDLIVENSDRASARASE